MTPAGAVVGALVQHRTATTEGHVVGAVFLIVVGVASVAIGWIGWRHAQGIVPSSLPEKLFWKRVRVIRRGSVTFLSLGVLFVAIALWAAVTA